jgi:hypothetical protein
VDSAGFLSLKAAITRLPEHHGHLVRAATLPCGGMTARALPRRHRSKDDRGIKPVLDFQDDWRDHPALSEMCWVSKKLLHFL